jgi:hypothetical protein
LNQFFPYLIRRVKIVFRYGIFQLFLVPQGWPAWIPELIASAGPEVSETYIDFFTSTIRNRNTRLAYASACWQFLTGAQLMAWNSRPCDRSMWLPEPAHSVRGPKYVVKKGKTPIWSREDAKTLLDLIPKDSVSGLRDLALIAAMFYSFACVSALLKRIFYSARLYCGSQASAEGDR